TSAIGSGNLHLDSEDLDRNGILDAENPFVGGNLGYRSSDPTQAIDFGGSVSNAVDHTTWKFVRVPLNISTTTAANWSAIKEMRVTLRPVTGQAGHSGTISIAKIAVVGNKWQAQVPEVIGSTLTAAAINTEDDATYVSPLG